MTVIVYLKDGTSHTYTDVKKATINANLPNLLQIRQECESWFYNMDEVRFYGCYNYEGSVKA